MPSDPGESGVLGEHGQPRLGGPRRRRVHGRAPGLHHRAAVRLLVVGRADHPDLAVDPVLRAGERQRAAPLPRARLGGEPLGALDRVVVRLRHGGVRLVRPGRGDALVLVVDPGGRVEQLLQAAGPEQRRRPPQLVDVEDRAGDVHVRVAGDLLADQLHREQRREVVRPDRLARARVQRRRRWRRQVGDDVVPLGRDLRLIKDELGPLAHGLLHLSSAGTAPYVSTDAMSRASVKSAPHVFNRTIRQRGLGP